MASLEGFADAKRSAPVAYRAKTDTPTPSPQRSTPLAGFAPAAKPVERRRELLRRRAKPSNGHCRKSIRARTGAAAILPGRDGGAVPRGPRLSDKWVRAGSCRQEGRSKRPPRRCGDVCDDCGWRDCART